MALLLFAAQSGFDYTNLRNNDKIIRVQPFSSSTKMMITLYQNSDESYTMHLKGAPEKVLEVCNSWKNAQANLT